MVQKNNYSKFAFLVHLRSIDDVYKLNKYLRIIPKALINYCLYFLPDIKLCQIYIDREIAGRKVQGELILIPRTASQILKNRTSSAKKIIRTLDSLHSRGFTYVGLGALTSVVLEGGKQVSGYLDNLHVTNGNALTVGMSFLGIKKVFDSNVIKDPVMTIVGATGSIGYILSIMIARELSVSTLHLVGRTPENLNKLKKEIESVSRTEVFISELRDALRVSQVVVTATSAEKAIITSDMLKQGAIVYDLAQPPNLEKNVRAKRSDVVVIDGGLVKLPEWVHYKFDLGIPSGQSFACMAETILLAIDNHTSDFSIGRVDEQNVIKILDLAKKYLFEMAPFQRQTNSSFVKNHDRR